MTHSQLELMLAESQVAADEADELRDLLAPLTDLATEAPEPCADLVALFCEGNSASAERTRVLPLGRRRRSRGAVAGAVVLAISGVGATGLSAAANTLPSPLQHQVSKFSQDFLPFKLPEPPPRSRHAPDAAQVPKPGSVVRRQVGSRDADGAAASRSLEQPRRSVKRADGFDHDSGPRDAAAERPHAEQVDALHAAPTPAGRATTPTRGRQRGAGVRCRSEPRQRARAGLDDAAGARPDGADRKAGPQTCPTTGPEADREARPETARQARQARRQARPQGRRAEGRAPARQGQTGRSRPGPARGTGRAPRCSGARARPQ